MSKNLTVLTAQIEKKTRDEFRVLAAKRCRTMSAEVKRLIKNELEKSKEIDA